jgi:acyl-coenzyme A synthetase/AMP-(fatty) acid ligase
MTLSSEKIRPGLPGPSSEFHLSHRALLPAELRERLAGDPRVGGGNLLRPALEVHPQPDVPFIHSARPVPNTEGDEQTEFSLLDLDRLTQSWSVWYLDQGVRPRDRVAIHLTDTFAYAVHFYALSQIGAIPVLINSRTPGPIAAAICRRTAPVGVYADRERARALEPERDRLAETAGLRWVTVAEDHPAPAAATLPDEGRHRHAPDDPVVLLHSSGTTGVPKSVIHTHYTLTAGPKFRLLNFTESTESLMMTALPQSHIGPIGYGTYALLAGTPLVALYDPTAAELAEAVRAYRPTTVLSFGPVYAHLATLDSIEEGALDSVDGWISMADAVHDAHIRRILGRRSADLPPAVFYDRFGSSELGWGLMVEPHTLSSEPAPRRIGKPDALAEAAVLREDGSEAEPNEYGLLGIKSPSLTVGYWNDSDVTYRSKLAGYWLSGDIVRQDENGYFFQVDRAVDVIETATGTGYSVLMEELLLGALPEIGDCAVVAGGWYGATVPVAVVTPLTTDAEPHTLFDRANRILDAAALPRLGLLEIVPGGDVPYGLTGKVLKRRLREQYRSISGYIDGHRRRDRNRGDDRTGNAGARRIAYSPSTNFEHP